MQFFRPLVEPLESRRLLSVASVATGDLLAAYGQTAMSFEPNVGQTDSQVRFLSRGDGYTLFLTSAAEAVLRLRQPAPPPDGTTPTPPTPKAALLDVRLVGDNSSPQAVGLENLPGVSNYLIGNDPSQWHTDVPNYARVAYQGVYPGIDLAYYGQQRQLEYDFTVAPGADPNVITLDFEGAASIDLDARGNLVLNTAAGNVVEDSPVIYQQTPAGRQEIPGHYQLSAEGDVGFAVGPYDHSLPLTIDPVVVFASAFGGSISNGYTGTIPNFPSGIAVDSAGSIYVVGATYSADFPTVNPLQSKIVGSEDGFITKMDPDGKTFVYSTYLPGTAGGVAVDAAGDAYVTGATGPSFPITQGALQTTYGGGGDAFVAKLNPSGSALVYSTILGGSAYEAGTGIALDRAGDAYVTGFTQSSDFRVKNAYQPGRNGLEDAFVAEINPDGSDLLYATYLGGSISPIGQDSYGPKGQAETFSNSIAVDAEGNAYVTGLTYTTDFPMVNAAQAGGDGYNAFVTKLNPAAGKIVYSTFLGGPQSVYGQGFGATQGNAVAVDAAGDAYVTGWTTSTDFPTRNPLQPGIGGGVQESTSTSLDDAFVTKFSPDGSLLYSTYLGGSADDEGFSIAVDAQGDAYVTVGTDSINFPTMNAVESELTGDSSYIDGSKSNLFITKLNAAGSALVYSTYFGYTGEDFAVGIALDAGNSAYVLSQAGASVGVLKLSGTHLTVVPAPITAAKNVPFSGLVATFTSDDTSLTASGFTASINWGDGSTSTGIAPTQPGGAGKAFQVAGSHTYAKEGAFPVVVTVTDSVDDVAATTAVDVSRQPLNEAETTIAVDPKKPLRVFEASNSQAGARAQHADPSTGGLFAAFSDDGGITWQPSDSVDQLIADGNDSDGLPAGYSDPHAIFDQFGNLFLTYIGSDRNTVFVAMSTDGGRTFSAVGSLRPAANPGTLTADYPSIAVGPGTDPKDPKSGSVWVSFTDLADNEIVAYGAPVSGLGTTGGFPDTPEALPNSANGSFASIAVGPAGQVLVTWQDNATYDGDTNIGLGPDSILASRDSDGLAGAGFSTPIIATSTNVGGNKPIPPQFTRKIMANANLAWDRSGGVHDGRVYLAYTDAFDPNSPDTTIKVRFSDDNGANWSNPVRADDTDGFDSPFEPTIAVDQKTGDVGVVWYDTRNDKPNDVKTQFFAATSSDGGQTFSAGVRVSIGTSDATDPNLNTGGAKNQYGDYTGLVFQQGMLIAAWSDNSAMLQGNPDLPQFDIAAASVAVAHVTVATPLLRGVTLSTSEGGTPPGAVATFTDADQTLAASDFTAQIEWGDGATTNGVVTASGDLDNDYIVRGDHAYVEEGTYPVHVTIHDQANDVYGSSTVNVSRMSGNQSEVTVAANPNNPDQIFAASNIEQDGMFGAYSSDGGTTWHGRVMADGKGDGLPLSGGDPKAAFDAFGNLFLVYLGEPSQSIVVAVSKDFGMTFTVLGTFSDPAGVDQPSVATGPGQGGVGGSVWVSFEDRSPSPRVYAAGAAVTPQGDVLALDTAHSLPGSDGGNYGHIAIGPNGQVLVSYMSPTTPDHAATIYASLDADGLGPATFALPVPVAATNVGGEAHIPPQMVRGVQAEAFLAWDRSSGPHRGRVYLTYTDSPAVGSNDTKVFVRFSDDNGASWSAAKRVNDDPGASSQFFPAIAVDQSSGDLALGWYDARNDPSNVKTEFFVATSGDGSQSFSANIPASLGASDATLPEINESGHFNQYGDYEGLAFAQDILYPAWTDNSAQLDSNPDRPQFEVAAARLAVAHVADQPLTANPMAIDVGEGESFTENVASFTDANTQAKASDFTATLDWGDGADPSTGTVTASAGGGFIVSGAHAYEEEGTHSFTVTISDKGGASATVTGTVQVADGLLKATGQDARPIAGQPFSGAIATFTDEDPNGMLSDYTVNVDWGDGKPSTPGMLHVSGSAGLTVSPAAQTFYAVGNYDSVKYKNVNPQDDGVPYLFTITFDGQVVPLVKLGDGFTGGLALNPTSNMLSAIANDASGSSTLETIDLNQTTLSVTSSFAIGSGFSGGLAYDSADGRLYAIATDAGGASTLYRINADHSVVALFGIGNRTYAGLTFDDLDGNFYAIGNDTGDVSTLYQITLSGAVTSEFVLGDSFTGGLAFDDHSHVANGPTNLYAIGGSGSATFYEIPFGTGITGASALPLFEAGANFNDGVIVTGTHTYAAIGSYAVNVQIRDVGGSAVTAESTASVVSAAPTVAATQPTIFALQGIPTGLVAIANFSVPSIALGPYTAAVDWHDGKGPQSATITISGTSITVSADHQFSDGGPATFDVTLSDAASNSATAHESLVVRTDVTSRIKPISSGLVYNPTTHMFAGHVTITNTSSTDITGPLPIVFKGLPAGAELAGATGTTSDGDPYLLDSPPGPNNTSILAAGQSSTFEVDFSDPLLTTFSYSLSVFDPPAVGAATAQPVQSYGKLPLSFEPNVGQTDGQVQFLSRGGGYALFLTSDEAVLNLQPSDAASQTTVRLQLAGANSSPQDVGLGPLPGMSNYLGGSDPSQWHTNIPTYAQVEYKQVYPGVDLIYYGNQQQLEYDFVVAPGADPGVIQFAVAGADTLSLDPDGNLVIHTGNGDVVQHAPSIYQEVAGAHVSVAGCFVLEGENHVGFTLGAYDRSRTLTIDPVLVYSTFLSGALSGSYGSEGDDIAVDAQGNAYVAGRTYSADFPSLTPLQSPSGTQLSTSDGATFVVKLNAAGSAIVYSTFLSGSGPTSIAVDSDGNAIVGGQARAPHGVVAGPADFPTINAFEPKLPAGAFFGGFVAKLNASGTGLVFSTYLGGGYTLDGNAHGDHLNSVAVDAAGNVYATGITNSASFPTANAFRATDPEPAGHDAAFVAKFTPAGTAVYSTYLGGSTYRGQSDGYTDAYGIAADAAGNAYLTGATLNDDFPTVNALQPTHASTNTSAFVTKLNPTGSALSYSTYYGGQGSVEGLAIAVDSAGNAYIAGNGYLDPFDADVFFHPTPGATQQLYGDGFLTKLTPDGSTIVYAAPTFGLLRGEDDFNPPIPNGRILAINRAGDAYVLDYQTVKGFTLVNPPALPPATFGVAVAEYNATGTALVFDALLGNTSNTKSDVGYGLAVDAAGNAYLTGYTSSHDFPTTNAMQSVFGGTGLDAFIAKIASPPPGDIQVTDQSILATEGIAFSGLCATFNDTDGNAASSFTATVDWGDGTTSPGTIAANAAGGFNVTASHTFADEGFFPYSVTVQDSDGVTATSSSASVVTNAAGLATFHVSLNTTELAGAKGQLAFQFNPGALPGAQAATATISKFVLSGGTLAGSSNDQGGASGSLAGTVQIANSDMLNELSQPLSFGTAISFDLTLSGDALERPSGGLFGSAFAVQLLSADGNAIELSTDASGAVLLADANPDGSSVLTSEPTSAKGAAPVAGTTNVVDAPLTASGTPIQATATAAFSGVVATFTDADSTATADGDTATIDWGDGVTSPGAVMPDASGFDVTGSHTYAVAGSYPIGVQVHDAGGSSATAVSTAAVIAPSIEVAKYQPTIFALQGIATGMVPIARFNIQSGATGPFTATVDWHDGNGPQAATTTISGMVVTVNASHLFAEGGAASFEVTLTNTAGSSANADLQLTVRSDVTSRVKTVSSGLIYDPEPADGEFFFGHVTITNTSSSDITGPLPVVFKDLPNGVTVHGALDVAGSGVTGSGDPYVLAAASTLAPGQSSTFTIEFDDPTFSTIGYTLDVFDPPGASSNADQASANAMAAPAVDQRYGQLPLSFEPNENQADSQVQFLSRGNGYGLFLEADAAMLALRAAAPPPAAAAATPETSATQTAVTLKLIGANASAQPVGLDPLPGTSNYLTGNDPNLWHTDIPTYERVKYAQVYPGVDLVYYGNQQQLEYDFVMAAGANPSEIQFAVEGAESLELDAAGNLIVRAAGGDVVERAPQIYQVIGGTRTDVPGHFVLGQDNRVGFAVGAYDKTQPLTIDPVLVYSTYLGGSGEDQAKGIAVDSAGNAYITGLTESIDFPTANAAQPASGGSTEVFVTKLNAAGALVYSTYLGGSGEDQAAGIAVDSAGDAYVTGVTNSRNFPTVNAIQPSFDFGLTDAFVAKLNPTGSGFVYSTYLGSGGNSRTNATAIAVDSADNVYLTGNTNSKYFPTFHALQSTFNGQTAAFVTKINPTGSAFVYSTFLGGLADSFGDGSAQGTAIAVDSTGNAYVTGSALAYEFPIVNALQSGPLGGGNGGAFVTKVHADGSAFDYSTFIGESETSTSGIAVNAAGEAYITGDTENVNFPAVNAALPIGVANDGSSNIFVLKLSADDSAILYSTGVGRGNAHGIALDARGDAYVTGETDSPNFPVLNAIQADEGYDVFGTQDQRNAFLSKFSADGSALLFATYLGGSFYDVAYGIAVDVAGNAYLAGVDTQAYRATPDFPVVNALQPTYGGQGDAFVAKISTQGIQLADQPVLATEGISFTGVVGSFTDDDNATAASFTATIDWGDGSTSAGTISQSTGGAFKISGTHTYAQEGFFPLSVSVLDSDGSEATASQTTTVTRASGDITYHIFIDTSSLAMAYASLGGDPAPHCLAFQFNPGALPGVQSATATISRFAISGGGSLTDSLQSGSNLLSDPPAVLGSVSGSLASSVTFTNAGPINELVQPFILGTGISFDLTLSGDALENPAGGTIGSSFTLQILATTATFADQVLGTDGQRRFGADAQMHHDPSGAVLMVDINPDGSTVISPARVNNVVDAPLTATGASIQATATASFRGTAASFTDTNPSTEIGDYTASIDWGDGTTSAGTIVANASGGFDVTGGHTYANSGTYTLKVEIDDAGGSTAIATSSADVAATTVPPIVSITGAGLPIVGVEGAPLADVGVATFTVTNASPEAGAFSATIDWGDGATSAGAVSLLAGTYMVSGSHSYAEENNYPIEVAVAGAGLSTTVVTQATIADASLTATAIAISATEGAAFSGAVATFSDADPAGAIGDYTARIIWGDGGTSDGSVVAGADNLTVAGSHTYSQPGTFNATVEIDDIGGAVARATTSADVAATTVPPIVSITGAGLPIVGVEGAPLANVGVATFTVTNASPEAGAISATIDWGDDATSAGAVSLLAGTYKVSGSHSYAEENNYPIEVAIAGEGLSTTVVTQATIADASLTATAIAISATEGAAFSGAVATFSDADPAGAIGDYTARIIWGDGGTSDGSVVAGADNLTVSGSRTYSQPGTFNATVEIDDVGGAVARATTSADVAATTVPPIVSITGAGLPIVGVEGAPLADVGVATFTVTNASPGAGAFSATINWGDGTTSAGAVSLLAGAYTVSGSHSYAEENSYPIEVAVTGAGLSTTVATQATIADASLTATAIAISATEGAAFSGAVANFTDADPNGTIGDFTAQVVWGDGTTDTGTIGIGSGGGFVVSGSHTYAADGTRPVAVTIHDVGGSNATVTGTANVAAAPAIETIGGAGLNVGGHEFSPLANIAIATFTSSNLDVPASAFTATIDWGDGMTSAGSVVLTAGTYTVLGSHEYADEGRFAIQVSVEQISDSAVSAAISASANMHEQQLAEGALGTPDQTVIQEIYRDAFNRQAEPKGREIWTGLLTQGTPRGDVAYEMLTRATSEEFQQDTVAALYQQYLHRAPEQAGMQTWVAYLYGGGTIEGLTLTILGSPEYRQGRGGGTAEGFLKAVFQDALGRPIDAPALAFFEGLIAKGISTADVAAAILSSDEYHDVRVGAMFEQFLDRSATPSELQAYSRQLIAGTRDEQIMAQLIASDEYFQKTQG